MNSPHERGFVPLLALVGGLVVGGYALWAQPFGFAAPYVGGGILALSVVGILYTGWQFVDEWSASEPEPVEPVPVPAPLAEEVRDERAGGICEFCRTGTEDLDVHHVTPPSNGGSNVRTNLIALCGTCREKAIDGVYSEGELRDKVREQERQQDLAL